MIALMGCGAHKHKQAKTAEATIVAVQAEFAPFKICPGETICAPASPKPRRKGLSAQTNPLFLPYLFYRDVVSPTDGPRCHHYPTCSMYAMRAVRKRGPVLGAVMALDRIISPAGISSAIRKQPAYLHHGNLRYLDPVEANDFWMDDL